MSSIVIKKSDIVALDTDAIVNAANEGLWAGSGVCGAIFDAAGFEKLENACYKIGHCDTGSAVITPGFNLKSEYIIHPPVCSKVSYHCQQIPYGDWISFFTV